PTPPAAPRGPAPGSSPSLPLPAPPPAPSPPVSLASAAPPRYPARGTGPAQSGSISRPWRHENGQPLMCGRSAAALSASALRQGFEFAHGIPSDCGKMPMPVLSRLYDHLDGVLDTVAGVAQRLRQLVEGEGVRVDKARVKALRPHQGLRTVGGAFALAANAVDVDVVANQIGHVDRHGLVREGGKAHLAAAVEHAPGGVDGAGRTGALNHIVHALAAIEPKHGLHRILLRDVDDVVGAQCQAL